MIPTGTAIILHTDTHVWVRLREHSRSQNGLWEVPGGEMEANETPLEAACREVWEEAGIFAAARVDVKPLDVSSHTKQVGGNNVSYDTHWFSLKLMEGEVLKNNEPEKASDWLKLRAESCIHLSMMPGLQELIERLFNAEVSDGSLPVGTRIRFLKTLNAPANEDRPAITYAEKGDGGEVTGHGCKEGHWVQWDRWPHPFGATLGEDFEAENQQCASAAAAS